MGSMEVEHEATGSSRWPLSVIGWDGVLPWLAAATPLVVKMAFPDGHPAEILPALFVPILTALARAAVGHDQIVRINHGSAPWLRQIALAVAIAILFVFEIVSAVLVFADDAPAHAWLVPLGLYGLYLAVISFALSRPRSGVLPH
jgi:hypothetical protein